MRLLEEADLLRIERENPAGLTSARIVQIFEERGVRLTEATFRKYVQRGLLPRSVRVGQKGKHKGSQGMYPPTTVRQLNEIKRMLALDYTIEEIQQRAVFLRSEVDEIRRRVEAVVARAESAATTDGIDENSRRVRRELEEVRRLAEKLLEKLAGLEVQFSSRLRLQRAAAG
jgi:DNA-binding transcriptional MerR regulator